MVLDGIPELYKLCRRYMSSDFGIFFFKYAGELRTIKEEKNCMGPVETISIKLNQCKISFMKKGAAHCYNSNL
jgi:hypothetical protein